MVPEVSPRNSACCFLEVKRTPILFSRHKIFNRLKGRISSIDERRRDAYNFISSSPRAALESWNRPAPSDNRVMWGSGGTLGDLRDDNTETGGNRMRGAPCALRLPIVCGCEFGNGGVLLRPKERISARVRGIGLGAGLAVTIRADLMKTSGNSPTISCSCTGTSSEPDGSGPLQAMNWMSPEGLSYSHSSVLPA